MSTRAPASRVLVIEDDALIRTLLTEILLEDGYDVTAVEDGRSALKVLKDVEIHAVVTDFNLPDMDGLAILSQVSREYPRAATIVITGYGTVDLAVNAMKAGAVDFLTKPFQPALVSLTLKKVLEVQRLRQENAFLKQTVLKQPGAHVKTFVLRDMDGAPLPGSHGTNGSSDMEPALRQAFERGMVEGDRLASEREAEKLAARCRLLDQAVRQTEETCLRMCIEFEQQAAALAFEVARKIVRECAEEKRDVIVNQVRTAVTRVHDAVREHALVRIRVHPDDLPVAEQLRDMLAGTFEARVGIMFEGDADITRGGCVVQTGTRLVDATLESQLDRLAEPFQKR
jgi:flagellar assembly protein FliH